MKKQFTTALLLGAGLLLLSGCQEKEMATIKPIPVEAEKPAAPEPTKTPAEEKPSEKPMDVPAPAVEWTRDLIIEKVFISQKRAEVQKSFPVKPVKVVAAESGEKMERYDLEFPKSYQFTDEMDSVDMDGMKKHNGLILFVTYNNQDEVSQYTIYYVGDDKKAHEYRNNGESKKESTLE